METASPPLYYLIYASTAARPFGEGDLLALLTEAREFNRSRGITGLLLYSPDEGQQSGTFVQFLEGPRLEVQSLYVRITRDARNRDCTLLQEGTHYHRRFGEWTMGFRDLSSLRPEDVPGYNAVYRQHWTLREVLAEPDPILQLLYSFAGL